MERELGRTGVKVFPIGLGAMPLSLSGRPAEEAAMEVFRAALDAGVTLIDTANAYCKDEPDKGHNERLIARALKRFDAAGRITVATKGGMNRPGGAWEVDGRPAALRKACEQSLRDLGVETIALYQLHWPDSRVPYADSVGELARLQAEGKIRHVGISNVSTAQLAEAQRIVRVETVQNRCSPFDTADFRNGVVRACEAEGIAYIAHSPVGGFRGHEKTARHKVLRELGARYGCSPYRVALAWLLAKNPCVVPIPGASRTASILDSAQAPALALSAEELGRIDAL